jgi:capsular polysaccharide biosynthesis protein
MPLTWRSYVAVFLRRWKIIALIVVVDVLVSGLLFIRSAGHLGYQACTTLYVADVSSPSLISAPQTTLETAGQLLSGETAANFFGDDILDVSQSQHVAAYVAASLAASHLPNASESDINGSITGSRRDRTLSICDNNPNQSSALAAATEVGWAMTVERGRFIGKAMAKRTYVTMVSNASASEVSARSDMVNLALRLVLGLLVAGGLALVWDALDPAVRERREVEEALGVPVVDMAHPS